MSIAKTFWMRSPRDFLAKLDWDIVQLARLDKFDVIPYSYQTINCAVAAWSMVDWVFECLDDQQKEALGISPRQKVKIFRKRVLQESPALAICREIADASKHRGIDNEPSQFIGTPVLDIWEKGEDEYLATMPIYDGRDMIDTIVLMREARAFWDSFMEAHHL